MKTFKGGGHPPTKKSIHFDSPVISVMPKSNMVWIPVTQGGAPNQPVVKVGDTVARGQKIAESQAFMSAPVHSSVSGVVKKIETHLVTGNTNALCIGIQIDNEKREELFPKLDPFSCSKKDALQRIREAGIAGMGGASFPTHVKLSPPPNTEIEFVIANGAECEPYLCTDAAMMFNNAEKIFDGMAIAMHITDAKSGILLIEDNKKELLPVLQKACDEQAKKMPEKSFSIIVAQTKYPQGGEKNITSVAVGREIPSGGLPFMIGCIIQNVATLKAISDAFRLGLPLIERSLTISGAGVSEPKNIIAPIGTCISDLSDDVIQIKDNVQKIIAGGPMMGIAMKSADFPIQKATSGVLFLTKKEIAPQKESACINCARCVDVCSCQLTPVLIKQADESGDLDKAVYYGLNDCVDCGTCAYVCPARIPLVQYFKIGKAQLRAQRQAAQKAAQ